MTRQLAVLHLDGSPSWGGGQNQVRLLMRELARTGTRQLCICPQGSALSERLQSEGLPVHTVPWRGGYDPRAFIAVWRAVRHYDVVHCHDAHALQIAILPAKAARKPVVAARRVPFASSRVKWNAADRVIAVSEMVRTALLESNVDEHRVRVIHSGTDAQETRQVAALQPSLRSRYDIPPDAFVAGNSASFYWWKMQALIPAAAALVPEVHWLIAGEGPERGAIEAAITQYDVADRVHLLGWIDDARRIMVELDVYVSPATEEALGTSILEAMAHGVPVIAADVGGPAEILAPIHAATGVVLVEQANAHALAGAVERVRNDPELRARIVAEQNHRLNDFTAAQMAALTLATYRELVAR